MGNTLTRVFSDSDSNDSPVYIAKDPTQDRHFNEKQELLGDCKKIAGVSGQGRQPLTIAVIGPPGCGKSSFLNTVFAAFSNTHWIEYANYGKYGRGDQQVTRRLKSFEKKDYYKDQDQYLMPTFLDMTGFDDDESLLYKELLNIVFCGKLKEGEKLIDVIRYGQMHGVEAVKNKYFRRRLVYRRVNRVIVVCSANPELPIPVSFFEAVKDVTTRERDITLYGVLTQADKYTRNEVGVIRKENNFMEALGIPETRFARIKNYCPDVDPNRSYEYNIVPSLDVPVLRLMRQVLRRDPSDEDLTVEGRLNTAWITLSQYKLPLLLVFFILVLLIMPHLVIVLILLFLVLIVKLFF